MRKGEREKGKGRVAKRKFKGQREKGKVTIAGERREKVVNIIRF